MRRRGTPVGFTLIEALVSIAILAGLLVMLAMVFRQCTQVTRAVIGGARVHQVARQVFEQAGRDLSGLTRDGFLFLRTQELDITSEPLSGLMLFFDEDGTPSRLDGGRTDVMVLTVAGYHSSATDASKNANFARVIWSQSERVSGNNLAAVQDEPKSWAIHQVLARHQVLMLPDEWSCDLGNTDYRNAGGQFRGPDCFNMGVSDLTRFFGPAMGSGGEAGNLDLTGDNANGSYGLFSQHWCDGREELTPFRKAAKVWRFGRDATGPNGEPPGTAGAGDLTAEQVDIDLDVPADFLTATNTWLPKVDAKYYRSKWIRGHERPRIFGSADYHRIVGYGVASFQVDWSDGRRDATGRLVFYPETAAGTTMDLDLLGPGQKRAYCWNALSPTSVRDTGLRMSFGAGFGDMKYANDLTADRVLTNWYTENAWGGYGAGSGSMGNAGWPWPRALRVRLLIYDTLQDPPIGYRFEMVYHLLVQ
jgi:type II secretory pathway component PulJ